MDELCEISYLNIKKNIVYEEIIKKVIKKCFEIEKITDSNLYISVTLTTPSKIREMNRMYRNIDKETDVLSFPMFEREELEQRLKNKNSKNIDILGDMVISIDTVEKQSIEYGHSFEREFSYMIVHSFYHLIGFDHVEEVDKKIMREKEENVLNILNIKRKDC
jgi:probable rRNA maturation factor